MALRITHTNNSQGHDGTYVYRSTSPMDPANLPAPIADEPPVAPGATFEYIDSPADGTYYYRTQDHEGGQVSAVSDEVMIALAEDFSSAQLGDEIGGGIYAGTRTIDAVEYHLVAGKASSEEYGLQWKTSRTSTSGTSSDDDGLANTLAMESAGLSDHPAASHCLSYNAGGHSDWYMPSDFEMFTVQANLSGHPEFADNTASGDYTWTSSEGSADGGDVIRFSDGLRKTHYKDLQINRVRPIRRIPV